MSRSIAVAAAAGVLAAALVCAPAPGRACINSVMEKDKAVMLVADAAKALEARDFAKVEELTRYRFTGVRLPHELGQRGDVIWATAQVRANGAKAHGEAPGILENAREMRPDDPMIAGRHAEALLAFGHAEEARAILEDLERRDLITEADGWAALARIRDRKNDAAGRDRAVARCVARAGKLAAKICPLPAPKGKSGPGAA